VSIGAPLESLIKAQALGLGFDLVGIVTLGPVETSAHFEAWLDRGYAGDMSYLARGAHARRDTTRPFAGAKSAIVVGMDYGGAEPAGPVARYARGDDYHDVMADRLRDLADWLAAQTGAPLSSKAYVDTGPILERELARKAGLGWIGKNTNLINPGTGSFFFIGALFVDLALEADTPFVTDHCGTCTRCLDACPTDALIEPRVLDATRCISYLTIEHRGEIPDALRAPIGDLLYGCDICQDVCPWNEKFARPLAAGSPYAARPAIRGRDNRVLASEILAMTTEAYTAAFRRSPMKRAKLAGLKRNAAIVIENIERFLRN
jgi:epoxyqueuosine reductase